MSVVFNFKLRELFFPSANSRGLADFDAGISKTKFNVLLIPTIGKILLIPSVLNADLRSPAKTRGKKILLIPC